MSEESEGAEDVRQAVDRLADLMLLPEFPERFREDPRGVLQEYDLGVIPDELVEVFAEMSHDELRVVSQVHNRGPKRVIDVYGFFF